MVAAANYPVALVSNGQNTRITTLQTTNMKGDHQTKPRALLLFLPSHDSGRRQVVRGNIPPRPRFRPCRTSFHSL